MRLNEEERVTTNKKILFVVMLLITTFLFILLGQLTGAALFFKLTSIPLESVAYDSLYRYWQEYKFNSQVRPYIQLGIGVSVVIALLSPFLFIKLVMSFQKKEEIHGSARWANDKDLKKSGLFPTEYKAPSILLGKMDRGKYKDCFVELVGQQFVGISAGTGQGKGVAIVIPNLVNYSDSVVCTDIKLENFEKTAGFRQSQGQDVFLFAPDGYAISKNDRENGVLRTHRWNPFYYIRRNIAYRIGDILTLSNSIYPLTGDGKSDIWPASSSKLFLGMVLWLLDTESITNRTPTLPYLLELVGVEGGLKAWMKRELSQRYLSDECEREFNTFLTFPDETQGSILANFNAPLAIYSDSTVAKAVSGNDFDFRELRRKGISIYIGVQPPNKSKFKGLLNLFFEQLINENTRVLPELDPTLTHQCLLLLDEFPAIGRVNQIKESIGFTRQYNLRYMLIYQDKSQLEDKALYGHEGADNILSNLACEIIYPPKVVNKRVKEISDTLGTKTVKVKSDSVSQGKKQYSKGKNTTSQKRELMKPDELVALGFIRHKTVDIGLKVLLLKESQRSFIMNKIIYFEEGVMLSRVDYSRNNIPDIPLLK